MTGRSEERSFERVGFSGFGVGVEFRVSDPEIAEQLRTCLPEYCVELSQGEFEIVHLDAAGSDIVIREEGKPQSKELVERDGAINYLEMMVVEKLLVGAKDFVHLHAAGCVSDGRAILAIGDTGAGKSTTATTWSLDGLPVLGDDTVLLDSDGHAVPFKRLFKSNPELLRSMGHDPADTPLWRADLEEAWFDPRPHAGWGGRAKVKVVAVLRFRSDMEGYAVDEIKPTALVREMLNGSLESGLKGHEGFDAILKAVGDAKAVQMEFGPGQSAARALLEI
ncbi:MAG: hypothetical protein OEZ54_00365 [Gemmatimonadota bacterium]|nr:hypothetical protein [Gemmatimonadota bacterium]